MKQTFTVPPGPETLSLDIVALGLDAPDDGIPDALELSLLNENSQSLVAVHRPEASSFFNVNPGDDASQATGVTFDGSTVTLDISALAPGSNTCRGQRPRPPQTDRVPAHKDDR